MPTLQVKTVKAEQVWQSPDKQRTIWELQLEYEGKPVKAQTFSKDIATPGWTGTVETYERGNNTFVKQPPKEDGGFQSRDNSPGQKPAYQPKDEVGIKAMWAIGQANSAVGAIDIKAASLDDWTSQVETVAQQLFLMVDRVKAVKEEPEKPEPSDTVVEDIPDDISSIFDTAEAQAEIIEIEDPWKPKS